MLAALLAAALLADPAQLDCPVAEMTATERASLEQVIAEQRPPSDPRAQSISRVTQLCADRYGWRPDATHRASAYVFTIVAADLARRRLAAGGIDVALLEQRLAADPAMRNLPTDLEALQSATMGFVRRNRDYLISLAGPRSRQADENLSMMGIYLASRLALYGIRSLFAER